MKYALIFGSVFSLALMNTACIQGNKYPKETRLLDSLQILVIKADSAVKMIDSAKIGGYGTHILTDLQLIKMSHIDSMSGPSADIFRNFNELRWSLVTVANKRGPLLIELGKSQKQLSHLSHDLQHGIIPSDSARFFIESESKKAEELVQAANMSMQSVLIQMPRYQWLAPKADSLIALIKEHKKI